MNINPKLVADYGIKAITWLEVATKTMEEFSQTLEELFPDTSLNVAEETAEETLTKEMLFDLIRKYAVEGANGMATIYKKEGDDEIFYLASVKDNELIDEKDNKFVVVKVSDGVKKEVKEMFAGASESEFGKVIIIR